MLLDVFQTYFDMSSLCCLPKSKWGSHSAVLNLTSSFLGKYPFSHQKCGIFIQLVALVARAAHIATKLFAVHCHIINIQTLKYHFPTVCTWGVMQLHVNPIWSTILGLSPAQKGVEKKNLCKTIGFTNCKRWSSNNYSFDAVLIVFSWTQTRRPDNFSNVLGLHSCICTSRGE